MKCGVALGSNLGDRLQNLRHARDEMERQHGKLLCSKIYETEPVDCEVDASPFLNAAVELDCASQPRALLEELRGIEKKMGRQTERARNAPRILDLDILYFGELVCADEMLAIPHPRLRERRFVLAPLCDIRPELILPGFHETIRALLEKLPQPPAVEVFSETW